ncbi:MAG: phenylalanine--tRNA ligase subunit beta [Alphaproteobacteria bacterium]|nr:phenylalanine--tRNA ligase subunit beta [Alphaproteobacteria bacterium]
MKFTFSWLKEHLETTATLDEVCARLTSLGLEVESLTDPAKSLAPFTIAEVLATEKHPDADRLKIATVNTGSEKIQVVCGAPNCRAGMKAVLSRPGDFIPGLNITLGKSKIRGVESMGMLCAADELGLGEDHEGIIELPADAPVGKSYAAWAGLDDPVIELGLTPNRPDCAGVRGVARDLAAAGLGTLKPQDIKPAKGTFKSPIAVTFNFPAEDAAACPHFTGRMIKGVKNGPSPKWLQDRLRAVGLRPISALVDITNFATLDCMRPLHVFDAAGIKGNLSLRFARKGEKLVALNKKTYELAEGQTVIADDNGVLSLGGIIGGEASGCTEATTGVFIEAAYFDPIRTARTGRQLDIASDARWRFERGIDPAFTQPGAELATKLILDLCGTKETQISDLVVAGSAPMPDRTITLRENRCKTLIGVDVPAAEQKKILTALGFEQKGGAWKAPSWRPDIEGEADLVEEIIRVHGIDNVPAQSLARPAAVTQSAITLPQRRAVQARRALAAQGLLEAVTWSFMPSAIAAQFGGVPESLRLLNPISSELDVMRPSILGNLILAAKRNADRGFADAGLFEVGPAWRDATPEGQSTVAAALRAGATPRHWAQPSRPVDAHDAKADALAALAACGAPVANLQVTADAPAWYHPGRAGALRLGPAVLAYFGEIHPGVLMICDAKGPMTGCEIMIAAVPQPKAAGTARSLLDLPALQPVARDFAFVVDTDVTAERVIKAARQAEKNLIADVQLFDVYAGKNVGEGKKSLAFSVTLQPRETSLTDAQIEEIAAKITAAVTKATGGTLRS